MAGLIQTGVTTALSNPQMLQGSESGSSYDKLLTGSGQDPKAQQPSSDKILGLLGLGFDAQHLRRQQQVESSVPDMLGAFGFK